MTHLLKLLDRMHICEMDPATFVEDTEQTHFPFTNGQIDVQTDKVKPVYPFSTSLKLGVYDYDKIVTGSYNEVSHQLCCRWGFGFIQ